MPSNLSDESFLLRAKSELQGAKVELQWGEDETRSQTRELDNLNLHSTSYTRARYLSQQFVDDLCSSDGVGDKLLKEVERVIFEAHDINQKEGTISFDELLELRASRHRINRKRDQENLVMLAEQVGTELDKIKLVVRLKAQASEKEQLIIRYTADRGTLISKGSEKELARLGKLNAAAENARNNVRYFSTQTMSLQAVNDEVTSIRTFQAPQSLNAMQVKYLTAGLEPEKWAEFLMTFSGNVDELLTERIASANTNMEGWKGVVPELGDGATPLIDDTADLAKLPLAILDAEIQRLQILISADRTIAERYAAVSSKIIEESTILKSLQETLKDYEGASDRVSALRIQRSAVYKSVFESLLEEEGVLQELYAPVMAKLNGSTGTLNKMSFTVQRIAHVDEWAAAGESLLDLRTGPFKGRGALNQKAAGLKKAWETGSSNDVLKAMNEFREANQEDLLGMSLISKDNAAAYKDWAMKFSNWLYSTDHIEIIYNVDYDGVNIQKLSPGTRGIVLLLLYLALDDADDRPLIIDQPEENLDPKSIYDELVGLFIEAKGKRQVIMVTHNANLVVNTDADQIIIASLGERDSSGMPEISYQSGGLEEEHIRKEVCNILEGGEVAFKERARRLRVGLGR